ncbi:MAG TPA: hypothetical protein ENN67_01085, partial [Firmicutes bacterium]|nr:hypothetical protein [Bacillota bacterium]
MKKIKFGNLHYLLAGSIIIALFLIHGCSGKNDPVTPEIETSSLSKADKSNVGVSDGFYREGEPRIPATPSADNQYLEGEVLVVLKDEALSEIGRSVLDDWPLELIRAIKLRWGTIFEMKITDGTPVPDMAARLKRDSRVRFAEPNYILHLQETPYWPNDPMWESDDPGTDPRDSVYDQWGPAKIGADIIWNEFKGSEEVVVAVIDTGVRKDHEDLKDNLWINAGEIPGNGIDDDENGWIDDTWGWDCWDNDNDPWDDGSYASFHGTACSGIIAATQDNYRGLSGIAPNVRIMALKVDLTGAGGLVSTVSLAFEYALINGANIASMSFGTSNYSEILEAACNDTWDDGNGVILMASAGNYNSTNPLYPSYYDSVMAIGATVAFHSNNQPVNETRISSSIGYYWGSSYGSHLTVMGFGEKYMTTHGSHYDSYWDGLSYNFFSGTSCACPMTAAVMALIKSYYPTESNQWCVDRIIETADDLDVPGFDIQTGYGRANALRAIYGSDRYAHLEDPDGFVQLTMQQDRVFDSIHDWPGNPYHDTEDLYKLTVKGNGKLDIELDIYTWGETLDLRVYRDKEMTILAGESVGTNSASDSTEFVTLDVNIGESYYIKVYSPGVGNSTTYGLTVHNVYDYISVTGENLAGSMAHHPLDKIPFLKLTFTTGTSTTLDELIINKSGTTPNSVWKGARLYRDTNGNGVFDSGDELIANNLVQVVNRMRFDSLNLPVTYLEPLVLFFVADLGPGPDGGTIRFSLESYKDVTTVEGFMASYLEFPVQSDLVIVGTDTEPPSWVTTVGIQTVKPKSYSVDIGWNKAEDIVTPPVKYNVYYTDTLPFNFTSASKLSDVAFGNGNTTDYIFNVPGLPGDVSHYFAVRAEDQAGNEDTNTVVLECIPIGQGDPSNPVLLNSYPASSPFGLAIGDNFLILGDSSPNPKVYDRTDPIDLEFAAAASLSWVTEICADGLYAYCNDIYAFNAVSLANPKYPGITDIESMSIVSMSAIYENWVYCVTDSKTLIPVDVANPNSVTAYTPVSFTTTGNWREIAVSATHIYISYANNGILVFDRSVPSAPVYVDKFGPAKCYGLYVLNNILLVTETETNELILY